MATMVIQNYGETLQMDLVSHVQIYEPSTRSEGSTQNTFLRKEKYGLSLIGIFTCCSTAACPPDTQQEAPHHCSSAMERISAAKLWLFRIDFGLIAAVQSPSTTGERLEFQSGRCTHTGSERSALS